MPGKNSGVCHGYRGIGHFFGDCPIKRRCPYCQHGFQKFFVVERETQNKGKIFKCCSQNCGFWDWCKHGEGTAESSKASVTLAKTATHDDVDDLSRKFDTQVRLNNDEELLISMNVTVTVRRGQPTDV